MDSIEISVNSNHPLIIEVLVFIVLGFDSKFLNNLRLVASFLIKIAFNIKGSRKIKDR